MNVHRILANRQWVIVVSSIVSAIIIMSCGDGGPAGPPSNNWTPSYACVSSEQNTGDVPDRNKADLGLDAPVLIKYNNGTADIPVDHPLASVTIDGDGTPHVTVSAKMAIPEQLDIVLSGTAPNGSLKIVSGGNSVMRVNIYMNGADITNHSGPAINIQNGSRIRNVTVHLVGGCDGRANRIQGRGDDTPPGAEQAKGAFFSEARVIFTGTGSLEIRSKRRHALVVDNSLEINSGNIIIHESAGDGIHANNEILVSGGSLQIKSAGDAIQNERNAPIRVTGGKMTLWTTGIKSHGIACDSNDVIITGSPNIKITAGGNGAKGIRSREGVTIGGGVIDIKTYGGRDITPVSERDPGDLDTTSRAVGIKAGVKGVTISNGTLTITSTGDNSRGIVSDGDVVVTGGNVTISAIDDGIKVGSDGYFKMSGGSVKARAVRNGQDIDCDGRYEHTGGTLDAAIDGDHRKGGGGF